MRLNFCVACSRKRDLHDHHLVARSCGGTDDPTNIITLCARCHGRTHNLFWQLNTDHRELICAGLRRARSEGKQLGRPPIAPELEERIRDALKARKQTGEGVRKIAARFKVGPGTVQRISTSPFDASGLADASPY